MKGNKEKDITQKTLERYDDVFADIINVLLFNGERVVTEDSLTDVMPGSILKMDGRIRIYKVSFIKGTIGLKMYKCKIRR